MLLLIAVVIIAAVAAVGQTLSGMFSSILNGFQ
jgi:Flp pilus assembly pilin Flp